jgi:succinate dehydrogenase / fumarate reductase cytochrome b subunit
MARGILIGAVVMHIVAAYQLTRISWAGRPLPYKRWTAVGSDYASRTMRWSGPILAIFLVYHLLDFTFGKTNPDYIEGNVYHNLISSFSNPVISGFYIVGMLALGLHLFHGIWSMFQTLGLNDTKYNKVWKSLAVWITVVVVAGNISMPVAVLLGVVK